MRFAILYGIVFGLLSCNSSQNTKPNTETTRIRETGGAYSFRLYDSSGNLIKPNDKLKDSWKAFAEAVQSGNYDAIRNLSTECISCEPCFNSDSPLKDSVSLMVLEGGGLPADYFFRNQGKECFDNVLRKRIGDSAKVAAHYDVPGPGNYSLPCIIQLSGKNKTVIVEFFITTIDRTEYSEGNVTALAFIETSSGYKFCGYSTIP